jgi:phosphoglycerate-specific signal transduction histidine kinase
LRTELEDARQSMQIAQKQTAEERKKLAFEYEQRIRQLTKDLEDNKRDLLSIQEHASNERRKLDEIHTRVITELNLSIQDLQFRLNQSNVDKNSNAVNEVRQVINIAN